MTSKHHQEMLKPDFGGKRPVRRCTHTLTGCTDSRALDRISSRKLVDNPPQLFVRHIAVLWVVAALPSSTLRYAPLQTTGKAYQSPSHEAPEPLPCQSHELVGRHQYQQLTCW